VAEFILFDRVANTARKFTSDDWYLGCVESVQAENPRNAVVPVTDAEPRAKYTVFFNSPHLDRALAKAKSADDVPGILNENGAIAGYLYLDTPSAG
jgi:hypothetical protein